MVEQSEWGDTGRPPPSGPWRDRVEFAPGGWLAYRPGEVLVHGTVAEPAREGLEALFDTRFPGERILDGAFVRFTEVPDVPGGIEALRRVGIAAQVNHVLFAACACSCCPPHPADPRAAPFYANPFYANAVQANPFYANPFYANPFYANAAGCGCCGSGSGVAGSPFYANADPSPFVDTRVQGTGRRRSSARPATPHVPSAPPVEREVRVAILDTGYERDRRPPELPDMKPVSGDDDRPDADGDGFLDPAAGHGTFIAGVIEQVTPGCTLEILGVLSTFGDGDEWTIAEALLELAERSEEERPHLVNLSFGGYSPLGMAVLAHPISLLNEAGAVVVASAGNDGTCLPMYPASLPGVVGVGALDADGNPAPFTNYGPWVRACASGVGLVSLFFEEFDGPEPPGPDGDPDRFEGWARWSGTSFAAPGVVAALARLIGRGEEPDRAVERLVDDPDLPRRPMLGTVVRGLPPPTA